MKINIDTKKGKEALSKAFQKTSNAGKKAAENVQKGVQDLSAKAKNESYLRRLKKYNPLFPDTYQSETFNIPNMIMIRDDAERRGIDVCEGAIGWLDNANGMEVMCLYDEAVKMSGIQFIPTITCDAIYYVDNFDRNRFIRTDCIFSKAHEERLAELKNIAYSLGAKTCSIEISEANFEVSLSNRKSNLNTNVKNTSISTNEKFEQSLSHENSSQRSGRIVVEFEGSDTPKRPKLKWFEHDENIKKLIEMRCKNTNAIKSETLELSGASSATMSQKTAYAIDGAISKMGVKGSSDMEKHAKSEHQSKLVFNIEF